MTEVTLRNLTIGDLKLALRDLLADHEARLFAYIDKLNADRERGARGRAAPEPGAPTTPGPPAVPTGPEPAEPVALTDPEV